MFCFFTTSAFCLETVTLCIGVLGCNFEKWEKQLQNVFPVSPYKSRKGEVSLPELSKPQGTRYRGNCTVDVFRNLYSLCARLNFLYSSRGVCSKVMVFTACKLLRKGWKWLTNFVQEVANKTGGRYPPSSLRW